MVVVIARSKRNLLPVTCHGITANSMSGTAKAVVGALLHAEAALGRSYARTFRVSGRGPCQAQINARGSWLGTTKRLVAAKALATAIMSRPHMRAGMACICTWKPTVFPPPLPQPPCSETHPWARVPARLEEQSQPCSPDGFRGSRVPEVASCHRAPGRASRSRASP